VTARLTRPGVATLVVALDTWTVKGTSMFSLVVLAALACSVTAFADSGPLPPAVAACKAEYQQLGPGGFAAKYGAGDAGLRACVQQHGGTKQQPQPTGSQVVGSVAYALCAADYKQLGANGFAAKYGSGDTGRKACLQAKAAQAQTILSQCQASAGADKTALERCIKNALGSPTGAAGGNTGGEVVGTVAYALCAADYKQLGANGFAAKYGSGDAGKKACLQAALPKARSILDSCKGAGGAGDSGGDAFKRCVTTAIKNALGR